MKHKIFYVKNTAILLHGNPEIITRTITEIHQNAIVIGNECA
jgi:hypothetical protein